MRMQTREAKGDDWQDPGVTVRDRDEVLDRAVGDVDALVRVGGYVSLRAQDRDAVEFPRLGPEVTEVSVAGWHERWSTDLGAPLHIDTDANPDLWGYLHLQIDKKTFREWLDLHLTALATIHGIELTRKLRRHHKSFYEQTIVTLRDKVQADEAFIYHPVPLTYHILVELFDAVMGTFRWSYA
ncbi:hypothetical protein [Streptomyces albogriseolus]